MTKIIRKMTEKMMINKYTEDHGADDDDDNENML